LIVLLHVGLPQFFVGVALFEFPVVDGLSHFLLERWQGSSCVELAWLVFLFNAGPAQPFFVWLAWFFV
jgi:hypothetical protein